ncbi:MAG: glycerophosphodiester phosphodiesterase family protein [Thermotogota bacterium]
MDVKILGHRGYKAKFPENTILSFVKALENGADGIEFDARLTKDGVVIIHHDDFFKDKDGKEIKIINLNFEELRKKQPSIPRLQEVLEELPKDTYYNLEIKEKQSSVGSYEIIKNFGLLENTLFSSFDVEAIKIIRDLDKEVKIGLLVDYESLKNIDKIHEDLNLYSLNLYIDKIVEFGVDYSSKFIGSWKSHGLKIFLWTVNNIEHLKMLKGHYDGVITDEVEEIVNFLR